MVQNDGVEITGARVSVTGSEKLKGAREEINWGASGLFAVARLFINRREAAARILAQGVLGGRHGAAFCE
jgi:hypothetical protein